MHLRGMICLPAFASLATYPIGFGRQQWESETSSSKWHMANYCHRVQAEYEGSYCYYLLTRKRIPKSACLNQRHVRDVGLRKRRCARANKQARLDGIDKMDQIIRSHAALTPMPFMHGRSVLFLCLLFSPFGAHWAVWEWRKRRADWRNAKPTPGEAQAQIRPCPVGTYCTAARFFLSFFSAICSNLFYSIEGENIFHLCRCLLPMFSGGKDSSRSIQPRHQYCCGCGCFAA